jgi:formyltetrahydrofolate hydrolase
MHDTAGRDSILLMSCPDQTWLVAEISCLYLGMAVNIVEAEQHIDVPQGIFLHRGVKLIGATSNYVTQNLDTVQ